MKLIFISGPSGSGKTTLSNQIIKKNKNGIVLSTDNYYKTGLISKLLPKFIEGFFDRSISFNNKLFKKDFDFIYKNFFYASVFPGRGDHQRMRPMGTTLLLVSQLHLRLAPRNSHYHSILENL